MVWVDRNVSSADYSAFKLKECLFLFDSDKVWVEIMGQRHMGGGDITSKETLKPPALDGEAWHPGSKETAS